VATFDPGSTNATIAVEILNDLENPEFPDETFYLNLSSPTNATLSDNQAVGTIYNYSGGAGAAVNVNDGATNITATQASLRGQVTAGSPYPEVTIYWWPEGGTTTAIPKGVQSGAFSNDIGGLLANMTYYYYCFATNASGTDTSATASFRTEGPQISIAPVTVNEPPGSGTTNARFAVTLSATSAVAVQVGFASAGGTAVQGADFDEANGTLVISAGLVATSITAVVHGDADYTEGDETFTITLGSPLEATIAAGQGTGTGTIRDLSIVLTNGTLTIDTTLGTMTHSVGGQVATGAVTGHTNMENGTWTYGLCTFQLPSVLILDSGVTVVLQGTNGLAIESGSDIRVGCVLNADGGSATTNNANAGIGGSGVCGGWSGVDYVLQAGVVGKGPGCGAKGRFGAGGAGYGGHGGAGYGTVSGGDSLATGGTTYAEYKLDELIGGSSGGGSEGGGANQWGAGSGAGGGAVMLSAGGEVRIEATGAVSANGGDGGIAAASRCAGGGSGGSVLLRGTTVTVNGILRANGGRSLGTAQKGGGGGGGRISILSTNPAVLGGSLSVTGGVGNATGSNGTVYVNGSTLYLDGEYTYVAGAETHSSATATNGATLDLRGGAALTVASNGLRGASGGLMLDGTGTLTFTDWNSNESQIDIDRLTVSNVLANFDETVAGATTYRKWKKYPRYSLSIGNGGEVRVTNAVSLSHDLVISGTGMLTRNGTAGTAARSVICRTLTTSQPLAFAPGEALTVSNSISLGSGVSVTANNNLAPDLTSSPVITVPAGASLCVTGNVAPANDGKLTINISGGTLVVTGKLDAVLTYNNHELELTAVNNARVTVGGNMRTAPNTATLNNTWIVSNSTLTVGGNLTGGTGNMDALGTNTFCGTSVVSVAGYVDQNRRKFFVSDTASLTVGGNAGALGMKLAASSGTALLVLSNSAALVVSNILEVGNASSVTSTNQFLLNNTATATVGGLVVGTNGTVKVNDSAVLTINSAPSFTNLSATIGLATGAKLYVLRSAFSTAQAEAAIAAGNIVPLGAPLRVGAISLAEVSFTEVSSTASSMQGTVFSIK
jgi:hypothetical protein